MTLPTLAGHWDAVYAARDETALTWHQPVPQPALDRITAHAAPGDAIVDVGGGSARLVDALLERCLGPVTVLDLSETALAQSRQRLGRKAGDVTWIAADVTRWHPARRYAIWHDRAVFHFLTDDAARAAYLARMQAALRPGGIAIISTFAADGPETCSSLPVCRYSPESLSQTLERHLPGALRQIEAGLHDHITPKGTVQRFQTSLFRRSDGQARGRRHASAAMPAAAAPASAASASLSEVSPVTPMAPITRPSPSRSSTPPGTGTSWPP